MLLALRTRAFRWLAAIYAFDALLEWFGSIALMVLVYRHGHSTTAAAGLLLCKQVIPGVLVSGLGNVLDRHAVRTPLLLAIVVQAGSLAATALIGSGAAIFGLAALSGTAGTIVRASLRGGTARSLGGERLRGANALLNLLAASAGLIGPAFAAVALDAAGTANALLGVAAVLLVIAVAATAMPRVAPSAAPVTDEDAPSEITPARTARAASPVPVSWLLALIGVLTCVFSMDDPALLAYSERSLHAGVDGYGAIFTAWGVGLVIGGLIFSRLTQWPMLRIYAVATVLASTAYLGLSVAPSIEIALALAVVGGVGNGMDWVALMTAVQEATPRGQEAAGAARLEAISSVAPGVGIVIGGVLADLATPRITLLVPGLVALSLLVLGSWAVRLREDRLRTDDTLFPASLPGGSA